jgi:hypothetical protein
VKLRRLVPVELLALTAGPETGCQVLQLPNVPFADVSHFASLRFWLAGCDAAPFQQGSIYGIRITLSTELFGKRIECGEKNTAPEARKPPALLNFWLMCDGGRTPSGG